MKDKKRNSILFVVVILSMTAMMILDIFSKLRNAYKYKGQLEEEGQRNLNVKFVIQYFSTKKFFF